MVGRIEAERPIGIHSPTQGYISPALLSCSLRDTQCMQDGRSYPANTHRLSRNEGFPFLFSHTFFCYTIPAFPYSLFPILSRAPLFLNSEASCSELCVVVQKPRRGPSRASPPHLSCFPGPAEWRGGIRQTRKFPKSVIHLFRRENRLSVSTIPPYVLSLSAHQSIFSFANFCDEANRRLVSSLLLLLLLRFRDEFGFGFWAWGATFQTFSLPPPLSRSR